MQKFNLPMQHAKVKNVNPRSELHGEEKELAMDLSIEIEITPDILNQLCVDDECPDYGKFFHDDKKMILNTGIKLVKFDRKYEDHEMSLSFSALFANEDHNTQYFKEVKIKSIAASPINGGLIKLNFTVQLSPIEKDIAMLTESVLKPCYIGIIGPSQIDFLEDIDE